MNAKQFLSPFILLVIVAWVFTSCTQGLISKADKKYEGYAYSEALTYYKKAEEKKPNDPLLQLKLANTYQMLSDAPNALKYYSKAADSIDLAPSDRLRYAKVLMENNQYEKAGEQLAKYLEGNPDDQLARDLYASTQTYQQLKEDTSLYILKTIPLQNAVSMFSPTPYGKGLVVAAETEITSAATTNPWTGFSYLDMYYMERNQSGGWMAPEPFAFNLNSRFHDGPASFNEAEDFVVFTRSAMKNERKQQLTQDNVNNFHLYQSKKVNGEWSEPEELPFNSDNYSVGHPALSPDGKTLYFSSDMPGGYGGSDIYMSENIDGVWSTPVNLGDVVNTPGNEVFPFIGHNGHLYFSSEAHQTLGGLDVQEAVKINGEWSKPRNLAYPLNSSRDDFGIVVNKDDTTGFVSSNRSGSDMVYEWTKVPPILFVEGIARLKANELPIEGAVITLRNKADGSEKSITTGPDGKFKFTLAPDTDYEIKGGKDGYFTRSFDISTGKKSQKEELDLTFDMDEIVTNTTENNKTYDVGNIYYDYDDFRIRKDAEPILNDLARMLKDNPRVNIEIQAHCDCRADDAYNDKLSEKRGRSVVKYLINQGVDKSRLTSRGFGERNPVVPCSDCASCSEADHQKNRRTEFIVTKQ